MNIIHYETQNQIRSQYLQISTANLIGPRCSVLFYFVPQDLTDKLAWLGLPGLRSMGPDVCLSLNPVHYNLCSEKTCNCQCYCTEEQLLHRKQFFPDGFSGPMVPVDPSSQRLHTLPGSLGPLCLWQCFIWDLEYISSTQSSKRKCKN